MQGQSNYHDQLMELMSSATPSYNAKDAAEATTGKNYGMMPDRPYKAQGGGTYNSPDMGRIPYSSAGSKTGGSGPISRNLW